MTSYISHRTDVVLTAVAAEWLTTADIDGALYDAGHRWTTQTTRDTLHYLASVGKIERRKRGAAYVWRTAPAVEAPAAEPLSAEAILAELRDVIDRAQRPAPASNESDVRIGAEAALGTLVPASRDITDRIVDRASYVTLRTMLTVLDSWIEGARENREALGRRESDPEQFHADDIRRMVNDAARELKVREPYIEVNR